MSKISRFHVWAFAVLICLAGCSSGPADEMLDAGSDLGFGPPPYVDGDSLLDASCDDWLRVSATGRRFPLAFGRMDRPARGPFLHSVGQRVIAGRRTDGPATGATSVESPPPDAAPRAVRIDAKPLRGFL